MLCRIIGGRESEEHAHPWIARVFGGRKINCNFFFALYAFELYSTITHSKVYQAIVSFQAVLLAFVVQLWSQVNFCFFEKLVRQRLFVSIYRWSSFSCKKTSQYIEYKEMKYQPDICSLPTIARTTMRAAMDQNRVIIVTVAVFFFVRYHLWFQSLPSYHHVSMMI